MATAIVQTQEARLLHQNMRIISKIGVSPFAWRTLDYFSVPISLLRIFFRNDDCQDTALSLRRVGQHSSPISPTLQYSLSNERNSPSLPTSQKLFHSVQTFTRSRRRFPQILVLMATTIVQTQEARLLHQKMRIIYKIGVPSFAWRTLDYFSVPIALLRIFFRNDDCQDTALSLRRVVIRDVGFPRLEGEHFYSSSLSAT
ncbi:hypothetical protein CDAR_227241 [Caerostris darwini]|uniref:Uncharacterized protein n=1 Tax=Caerostris darwini TaxID=1538125 RepID=A0AAV4ULL7_9ARAC|nr:hypothetical protein CDAR_227241 [Caerostris darwini]